MQTKLWVAPPSRMLARRLEEDGTLGTLRGAGEDVKIEPSGCSLCMGNQARTAEGATVVSTSTRNFPNRMGPGANVYLASGAVTGLASRLGRIPTMDEYMRFLKHTQSL